MGIKFALSALLLLVPQLTMGQSVTTEITNSDVISMAQAGISEETIILAIQRGPIKFDTSPQGLIALKKAGISDRLLNAMLASDSKTSSRNSIQTKSPIGNSGSPSLSDEARVASYERECDSGGMDACANLGFYYRMGWGVSKNPSQATTLIKKACDGGSVTGCGLLKAPETSSNNSSSPVGNPPGKSAPSSSNEAQAASYKRQCDSGSMDACANLGFYYRMGWGVDADPSQAAALIKKSCAGGSTVGCQLQKTATLSSSTSNESLWKETFTTQRLTLRVLQSQSVPYVQESGGGISTSCDIVGSANTSASANVYGNSAYGSATTNSSQHMRCKSYDTTTRWPHVLNVMFVQASDGNSYIIACDRAWRWSKCVPLQAGQVFSAGFTDKGLKVEAFNSKGKEENPTYHVLQSRSLR